MSTPQGPELHLDMSTIQRPVLLLDVSTVTPQGLELHLDLSLLQRPVLHLDLSTTWALSKRAGMQADRQTDVKIYTQTNRNKENKGLQPGGRQAVPLRRIVDRVLAPYFLLMEIAALPCWWMDELSKLQHRGPLDVSHPHKVSHNAPHLG
jgi:hypothetical protein